MNVLEIEITVGVVQKALSCVGIDFSVDDIQETQFLPSPGEWFFVGTQYASIRMIREAIEKGNLPAGDLPKDADFRIAYHATAITNAKSILESGFSRGFSETGGKSGVYCERPERKECTLHYLTHININSEVAHELLQWGVVFEVVADRNRGSSISKQWIQEPGTIYPYGMHIHAWDLRKAYNTGFHGLYRVFDKSIDWNRLVAG